MLSMMIAKHDLTKEELEKRYRDLADSFARMLVLLSKNGARSDEIHFFAQKELKELDLLPREPLGANFFIYIRELIEPLRAGVKETREFVKNWKGRQY